MSAPQIVFVDAETLLIDELSGAFGAVKVVGRVPNPRPSQFIRVERVGGVQQTRVSDAAQFVVEAWAESDAEAAALLNMARSHLFDLEGAMFGVNEYGGPARLPDPRSTMSRYTASFTIRTRSLQ